MQMNLRINIYSVSRRRFRRPRHNAPSKEYGLSLGLANYRHGRKLQAEVAPSLSSSAGRENSRMSILHFAIIDIPFFSLALHAAHLLLRNDDHYKALLSCAERGGRGFASPLVAHTRALPFSSSSLPLIWNLTPRNSNYDREPGQTWNCSLEVSAWDPVGRIRFKIVVVVEGREEYKVCA